jgi:hypothetical protein
MVFLAFLVFSNINTQQFLIFKITLILLAPLFALFLHALFTHLSQTGTTKTFDT